MDFTVFHHGICLVFFFLLPLNVLSQISANIKLGSSLTAQNDNNSWTSLSEEFAFGFIQSTGGGGYLLAIWFNKIPEKTVIWSANRNNLAQEGSRLQLLEDGRFLLNDRTGSKIWDADISGVGVAYGMMLDTGNFVLVSISNTSLYLWQSFDTPTDSLLPSQKLFTDKFIESSLSVTNYSSGRFHLTMQVDGNLVLYTDQNSAYWSTQIFGNDFVLVFNQSGPIFVVSQNGTSISSVSSNTVSSNQYYQRLTLDYDGVLRHYLYPKSGMPKGWSISEFLPSNICLRVTQNTGGGVCGYNSLCSFGNDHKVECQCPAKYSLIVPSNNFSSCKPDFEPQSCDNDHLNEISNFGFDDMINADWPLSDMEHYQSVSEDWCKQDCLKNCFCVAAIFRDNNCWEKKSPLSNGRIDVSIGGKALIKIRLDNSTKQGMSITTKNKKSSKSQTIIIVVCVALSVVALSLCVFITRRRWQKANTRHKYEEEDNEELPAGVTQYDFASIKAATKGFSATNMLGRGGFGEVFKGVLLNEKEIAVKRLSATSGQGEIEFRNEVKLLAKLQHKCLVRLLGFCIERTERLLIYEFMANGSLDKVLFDTINKSRLDWEMRYKIIKSIAKGLLYLHEDSRLMIVHRDLKASNILLDVEMNAKIADFGMARLFVFDEGEVITKRIAGTFGYMAPEYAMHGLFSVKSDVYSYGVLLLEIISGKKNNSYLTQDRLEDLPSCAYKTWREGKTSDLIDPMLTIDSDSRENMMRCIHIALLCVQENVGGRPTMAAVVLMLQSLTLTLPTPSEPGFFNNSEFVVPHWSSFSDLPESSSSNNQSKPMLVHGGRSDRSMNVGLDSHEFSLQF